MFDIDTNGNIVCVGKPESIDSQGAVNTPKNICDFVVEETLSSIYAGKNLVETGNYRIADICCGSGNFLLSAFEYIINHYLECYRDDLFDGTVRDGIIRTDFNGQNLFLSYKKKREILKNSIFGVDIDPLAVEVAKLSLILKLLEDVAPDELTEYMAQNHEQALPNLDENIKIGNSLVDGRFADYNQEVMIDYDLLAKIRLFDWQSEFGGCKFDAIVGNPPYIRVQKMVNYSPEEYKFYKSGISGYQTASSDLLDKYHLFVERGLSLLSHEGVLGYIVPHRFMNISSGKILRKTLAGRKAVRKYQNSFHTHLRI